MNANDGKSRCLSLSCWEVSCIYNGVCLRVAQETVRHLDQRVAEGSPLVLKHVRTIEGKHFDFNVSGDWHDILGSGQSFWATLFSFFDHIKSNATGDIVA